MKLLIAMAVGTVLYTNSYTTWSIEEDKEPKAKAFEVPTNQWLLADSIVVVNMTDAQWKILTNYVVKSNFSYIKFGRAPFVMYTNSQNFVFESKWKENP